MLWKSLSLFLAVTCGLLLWKLHLESEMSEHWMRKWDADAARRQNLCLVMDRYEKFNQLVEENCPLRGHFLNEHQDSIGAY